MGEKRIHYGRYSFTPPEGFLVQEEASLVTPDCGEAPHGLNEQGNSFSITFIKPVSRPNVPAYSEDPRDMTEEAYPVSITLTSFTGYGDIDPKAYLLDTCEALREHLNDFRMDYCVEVRDKGHPAAQAQCSFQSNFRIYFLWYSLIAGGNVVNSTMLIPEVGLKKGWYILCRFVESISL